MEKDPRSTIEWTRDIWKKKLHILPVHKDLPRLATGFEIIDGDLNKTLFKDHHREIGEISSLNTCKDILFNLAVLLPDQTDKDLKKANKKELQREKKKKKAQREQLDEYSEREIGLDDDLDDDIFPFEACDSSPHSKARDTHSPSSSSSSLQVNENVASTSVLKQQKKLIVNAPRNHQNETNIFANLLLEKFEDTFKDHQRGDLGCKFETLFASGVFDADGKFARVLKCIQQEILCPAVMDLHSRIYPDFPYKDVKGTWHVRIEFYFNENQERSPRQCDSLPSKLKLSMDMRRKKEEMEAFNKVSSVTNLRSSSLPFIERKTSFVTAKKLTSPKKSALPPEKFSPVQASPLSATSSPLSATSTLQPPLSPSSSSSSSSSQTTKPPEPITQKPFRKLKVIHRKREQSASKLDALKFEFEWELSLEFDSSLDEIVGLTIQVIDVSIGKSVTKDQKEDLFNLLANYMSPAFPFSMIWKRSARDLSLRKDLPSILRSLSIVDNSSMVHEVGNIFQLVNIIISQFRNGEEMISKIDPKLISMIVNINNDNSSSSNLSSNSGGGGSNNGNNGSNGGIGGNGLLSGGGGGGGNSSSNIMTTTTTSTITTSSNSASKSIVKKLFVSIFEEDNALTRVIKATSKEIVVPASSKVKNTFKAISSECIESAWRVVVQFTEHVISVTHYSVCVCSNLFHSSDHSLEIEWKLSLVFDLQMEQLLSAKTEIITYLFIGAFSAERRQVVLELMQPLVTPDTIENSKISISVDHIISKLYETCSKLPEKELEIDGLLTGSSQKISVFDLLQSLQETMSYGNISRILLSTQRSINS